MPSRMRFLALLAIVALVAGNALPALGQASGDVGALSGAQLLKALRGGGFILYFRHTSTDFGQSDELMTDMDDCASQRNLNAAGRVEAREIGSAIRALGIPIGDVLASPFCRTRDTAELMFGRATPTPALRGGPARAPPERYATLRTLLGTPVAGAVNLALTSHGNPFIAVAGGPYLAEGEAAVIEPRGTSEFRVVARIRKDEWLALGAPK